MTMRYFLRADPGVDVATGSAALLRLEPGAPLALGEALLPDGTWKTIDLLARHFLRGSNDVDITVIDAERAHEIVLARHGAGRYTALPDPMPADPAAEDPPRSAQDRAARDRIAAQAGPAELELMRRWAAVPVPPGAADISLGGAGENRTIE